MKQELQKQDRMVINQYFSTCCCAEKKENKDDSEIESKPMNNGSSNTMGPGDCYIFSGNNTIAGRARDLLLNIMPNLTFDAKQLVYAEPVYNQCRGEVTALAIVAIFRLYKKKKLINLHVDDRSKIPELGIKEARFEDSVKTPDGKHTVHNILIILSWDHGGLKYDLEKDIPDFVADDLLNVNVTFEESPPLFPKLCNHIVV